MEKAWDRGVELKERRLAGDFEEKLLFEKDFSLGEEKMMALPHLSKSSQNFISV